MSSPSVPGKLTELAAEARVSLGLVAKIKNLLLNREWIQESKDGLALAEPKQLLSQWADTYRIEQNRIFEFYTLSNVLEIERQLSDFCKRSKLKFAFTGFSGAARVAPFVRYRQMTVYVEEDGGSVNKCVNRHQAAFSWVTGLTDSIDILGSLVDILHQVGSLQTAKSLLSDQQHLPDDSPCVGHFLEPSSSIGSQSQSREGRLHWGW